ncbi:60S ribosomal protein L28 [Camelus dromedarius]|uniref:60S ribosomal protein L28 n=1 Tax=Camelus dromedarius TaxID=9838 RepID=A0A5N4CBA7_CAMDR|nr:60S ribosomal protein L28 [Camelus dromedarius]
MWLCLAPATECLCPHLASVTAPLAFLATSCPAALVAATSAHLQWMFLDQEEQADIHTKPNDLKAHSSFCYDKLIPCKTVGVEPRAKVQPVKSGQFALPMQPTINKNTWSHPQQHLYHLDLHMATNHRASATLRSGQKPAMVTRKRTHPTKSSGAPPSRQPHAPRWLTLPLSAVPLGRSPGSGW